MTREPFIVHCGKCSHDWAPCFTPVPIDTFAKVAKRPCPACGSRAVLTGPVPRETKDGDAIGWLCNGDTGTSSLTIWHVMMGRELTHHSVPWDPSDFGRCYRLLKVMPSWRRDLDMVAKKYPKWRGLVQQWAALEALYEEELPTGRFPKLYARMNELIGEAA